MYSYVSVRHGLAFIAGAMVVAALVMSVDYLNSYISQHIPTFPLWVLPGSIGVISMLIVFTVRRRLLESDFLKFQFVDVVTHKFRTPLTHIKWSAEALRSETDAQARARALDVIEQADGRLFEMTESLVGLSRADDRMYRYAFVPENIVDVLNETLAVVEDEARAKHVRFVLHIQDRLPHVLVDRKRIQFVLQMIVENAVVYSRASSSVHIDVEQRRAFIYIAVRDTGIGISPVDMSRLFSRFFRASNAAEVHTEGLGIGLSVSRDIMKRHGGDLWAESAGTGKGSTFYMKLPLEK